MARPSNASVGDGPMDTSLILRRLASGASSSSCTGAALSLLLAFTFSSLEPFVFNDNNC